MAQALVKIGQEFITNNNKAIVYNAYPLLRYSLQNMLQLIALTNG